MKNEKVEVVNSLTGLSWCPGDFTQNNDYPIRLQSDPALLGKDWDHVTQLV